MSHSVTNQRNNSQFTVLTGESILDAALREGRIYPYGCRSGLCGACKAELVSGTIDYGESENTALEQAEKDSGIFLLCQAKPVNNVVIDVAEIVGISNMQIKQLPCRINRLIQLADDVMQINLSLPKSQSFAYLPGQYIDILLKDGRRRSFSIANLPEQAQQDGLELHIRLVPDGRFTPRVFGSLKLRDLLRFEGPFGVYVMRSSNDRNIIMVAGGTGFAPLKGLIAQTLQQNQEQSIHLFWGARSEPDLYMHQLAQSWQKNYKNFSYTSVLSANHDPDWGGETGWVHDSVVRHYHDFSDYDIYASGPPVMIQTLECALLAKGMDPACYYSDSFEYATQV